ncbi:MAG: metallophosphoesterase [Clostridiales bacterium]|nr:metallophosphoesterase [Clostridiales bacterium]
MLYWLSEERGTDLKKTDLKSYFAAILLALLFSAIHSSAAAHPSVPIDIAVTFGKDPLTEKNLTWVTDSASKSPPIVVVQELPSGLWRVFFGSSETVTGGDKTKFKSNKANISGLRKDTTYQYFCSGGASDAWSGRGFFRTGAEAGDFTFLYMADPQAATDLQFSQWGQCLARAHVKFPDARFLAIAGDLVDKGSVENYWDKFFQYGSQVLTNLTVVPAIGNHDSVPGNTFSEHFNLTGNNHGLPDYVYSFDFGNARFVVLSTEKTYAELARGNEKTRRQANQFLDSQISFLRSEVSKSEKKWNVVILHKGVYSGGIYAETDETRYYRAKLALVFDELSIDAVLQGHNHTFDRAFLYCGKTPPGVTADSKSARKGSGTLYLTANTAGSKFYQASKTKPAYLLKHGQPDMQMYTGVTVSDDFMRFDTYCDGDVLFDTFTINEQL